MIPNKKINAKLDEAIQVQERWIESCGGNLSGYIARYGSEKDSEHYGSGGEAIYRADTDYLKKLKERRRDYKPSEHEEKKARLLFHKQLHNALDLILAGYIQATGRLLSKTTCIELMQWSHARCVSDEKDIEGEKK
jgi:hypothetical protein